jgi:SAM-dependent methyltransferase
MPSMFNARDADNYERLMGRWSRRLAPLFIEHAGIADGENVIEVGCGTGSLTFTLPQKAALGRLTAVDHSEIYLAAAKAKNKDPRISLEQGDGCALRFPDASFDRALSMLVLPSVLPEPELMVAEMRRVTRSGGVVAARSTRASGRRCADCCSSRCWRWMAAAPTPPSPSRRRPGCPSSSTMPVAGRRRSTVVCRKPRHRSSACCTPTPCCPLGDGSGNRRTENEGWQVSQARLSRDECLREDRR